ncbi:MAG: SGNH/GDSL hydrolase family protein [Proteobacteria bacterium]|nr:SGNH/GDSL hydrolase family protein [Pseudomonadota bacterium]
MTEKQNRFEKHSTKITAVLYSVIGLLLLVGTFFLVKAARDELNRGGERYIVLREPRPFQDISHRPSTETLFLTTGLENKKYRLRVDADGYIIPSKVHENADLSIVFLGGSTTECQYMDELARFPYLVGRHLENSLGITVNSFNTGHAGNNSEHSLFILQAKVVPKHPKIVVMMECVNDLTWLLTMGNYYAPHYNRGIIVEKEYNPIKNFILSFVRQKAAVQFDANDEFAGYRESKKYISIEDICAQYKKNLELFVFICKQQNIIPVLMTQFNRFTMETKKEFQDNNHLKSLEDRFGMSFEQYYHSYHSLNNVQRIVAAEQHIPLIDLDKLVPKSSEYMYDTVHLSEKGSRLVAEIIAKQLEPIAR